MPVEDHPVHARTKITSNYRYGCHNGLRTSPGYYAEDRQYKTDGTFVRVLRFIENKMSRDCKYDNPRDQHCEGCKHKHD